MSWRKLTWNECVFQVECLSKDEMGEVIKKYKMKSPVTGNDLSDPIEFNLMFGTSIGPAGLIKG